MPRTLLGILAILILAIGIPCYIWYPASGTTQAWIASAIRIGATLCAVWLAQPQLKQMSPTVWIGIVVVVIVIARFPKVAIFLIAALIVLAILRPRGRRTNKPVSDAR
ncbi:MAG: hypothetical protein WBF93_18535 [Pirellulales bacterium]|nr:hypothetical protein [Pirellulales bacterium]